MNQPQVACPHCQQAVRVAAEMAGQQARCPHCSEAFRVPSQFGNTSATHRFACPQCSNPFQVKVTDLGTTVACPTCRGPVKLPSSPTLPTQEPASVMAEVVPSSPVPTFESAPTEKAADTPAPFPSISKSPLPVSQPPPKRKTVDDILPPKFTRQIPSVTVAVRAELLGGVALRDSPVKLRVNGREKDLVRVDDDEKLRRRRIRNVVTWCLGVMFLLAVAKWLI